MPDFQVEWMELNIDNDAGTPITRFDGNLAALGFLRYDVTSIGAQLRRNGTAAIIGVGGGRDVLNCAVNGFRRIVGIEVNSATVKLISNRFEWFSGFNKISGFELHNDEGRSYLTRTGELFDLIQASLVDTWAATSAGAMTLSENALYTVDGWRVFYEHLKPGGIITFSRWFQGVEKNQTYRLFSVAQATLLSEGVKDPARQLALIQSGGVATLLVSNEPFTADDIRSMKAISDEMAFTVLVIPKENIAIPELQRISNMRDLTGMAALQDQNGLDYSPTFDASPYFFNAVRLRNVPEYLRSGAWRPSESARGANLRAMAFLIAFMLAAAILVIFTILLPAKLRTTGLSSHPAAPAGGVAYFTAIGLGFIFVEIGMMQQLSIFLGHPIYAMIVVLAGLILSTGLGSLASDKWKLETSWRTRVPALGASLLVLLYSFAAIPVILFPRGTTLDDRVVPTAKSALDVGAEWRGGNAWHFCGHGGFDGHEHRNLH
jgi:hypothetical protein